MGCSLPTDIRAVFIFFVVLYCSVTRRFAVPDPVRVYRSAVPLLVSSYLRSGVFAPHQCVGPLVK